MLVNNASLTWAQSRAKTLANLKVSGIEDGFAGLRSKLRLSWRALAWLQEHGQKLPPNQVIYVNRRKRQFDEAFGIAGQPLQR